MSDSTQYVARNDNWLTGAGNADLFRTIAHGVCIELKRQLTKFEVTKIRNTMRSADPAAYTSRERFVHHMVALSVKNISDTLLNNQPIDVHEMQKSMMSEEDTPSANPISQVLTNFNPQVEVSGILGMRSRSELVAAISPQTARKAIYIQMDTRWRSLETDGRTTFRWTLSTSIQASQGTVNNVNPVQNLISMRVFPVRIPYTSTADTYSKCVSMQVNEFRSQGMISQEQISPHFIFRPVRDGNFIDLETLYRDDGLFEFATPITQVDTITLAFGTPTQPVIFDNDRVIVTVQSYGSETVLRANQRHNLFTGDLIILSDFTTQNANSDFVLINTINNEYGINIDTSSVPDPTTDLSINIDTSALMNSSPSGTIAVTINNSAIVGTGTTFFSTFRGGDIIIIGGNSYTISTISSDTNMMLTSNYTGATASGLAYSKDNTISGLQFFVLFRVQAHLCANEIGIYRH